MGEEEIETNPSENPIHHPLANIGDTLATVSERAADFVSAVGGTLAPWLSLSVAIRL